MKLPLADAAALRGWLREVLRTHRGRFLSTTALYVLATAVGLIGPDRASPATSPVTLRNRVIRPVGGASTTMAS